MKLFDKQTQIRCYNQHVSRTENLPNFRTKYGFYQRMRNIHNIYIYIYSLSYVTCTWYIHIDIESLYLAYSTHIKTKVRVKIIVRKVVSDALLMLLLSSWCFIMKDPPATHPKTHMCIYLGYIATYQKTYQTKNNKNKSFTRPYFCISYTLSANASTQSSGHLCQYNDRNILV